MEWLNLLPITLAVVAVIAVAVPAFLTWQDIWYDYIKPCMPETKRAFIKRKLNQFKRELEDV